MLSFAWSPFKRYNADMCPFRIGSTSYIFPADILPNVMRLADVVDDIELVLFEVDDDQNNLPNAEVIGELNRLAQAHDLTYTVHLPLDLQLADDSHGLLHPSLEKALRVIDVTRPLAPWAYIVHLARQAQAPEAPQVDPDGDRWRRQATRSLEIIGDAAGDLSLLAVENLESYDPWLFLPLLDDLPVSLCVDLGHLIKAGAAPLLYLEQHLARTRVIHLHGCQGGRDHRGLELLPAGLLQCLVCALQEAQYEGVLTLEVFTERHFFSGRERLLAALEASA